MLDNVGILEDIGNYVTRLYIGTGQQFFRTFSEKAAEGKIHKMRKSAHKKEVYSLNVAKSGIKKSFVTR